MGVRDRKKAASLKPDGLHSEFQARAEYILRLCLKITNRTIMIFQSEKHLNRIVSQIVTEVPFRGALMEMPGSVHLPNSRSQEYSPKALFFLALVSTKLAKMKSFKIIIIIRNWL